MKYVCIDDGAVEELISGREYQSIDFEAGDKLIQALSGRLELVARGGRINHFQDAEGVFLTTNGQWKQKKYLVIDCEQSSLFTQLRSGESLTSFQKLLRFCAKIWSNGIYSHAEKIISGTTKAVLFPLPYSTNSAFRIAIEREPSKDRVTKRDMGGRFLLAYKSGTSGADSATEKADEKNFRRAFDRLPEVYDKVSKAINDIGQSRNGSQMASTELGTAPTSPRPAHMPFREWLPLLTDQQKRFIFAPPNLPHRLQGPAGTGKTLSLVLKTIRVLREAERQHRECHALIATHSEATRESIQNALAAIDDKDFQNRGRASHSVTLTVETLASLCGRFLRQSISETEFVDRDAQDSKVLQQLYIEQAIAQARSADFSSYKPYLSEAFSKLFEQSTDAELSSLLQHEISVSIKGRAGESYDVYKNCPSLKYGIPLRNDADKGFVYSIFQKYQLQLSANSQFDTDDVVISAVGQLDTPIWRRRREREGYDFIAIDETHLFNINELHVFHHFTRHAHSSPISFTVDQAQAVGDRGWNDVAQFAALYADTAEGEREETTFTAVFRSSPAIRDFCHSVLASGATLFTNFQNTMLDSQSAFTMEDERRSQPITYSEYPDDQSMVEDAFRRVEDLLSKTRSLRPEALITSLSDDVIVKLRSFAESNNKPVTFLERRGDYMRVKQAEKSGHLVLGHADYVGGLEFNVVVVVGVDKGRVPFEGESGDSNSRSYASYAAHNRLYVASSRARYALNLLGVKARGPSELLTIAQSKNLIQIA